MKNESRPTASRRVFLKAGIGALGLVGLHPVIRRASAASAKVFKIRLGHGQGTTHALHIACVKFAELVNERAKGRIEVSVFPSSQLGSMAELAEAVRMGTVEMYGTGNGYIETFAPKIGLVNLPGIMRDLDHAYKVMYTFAGKEVFEKNLLPVGIRIVGFVSNDFRHFTNSKRPIRTLADMKGLKFRVPNSKTFIDTVAAMGGSPVPIDWTETFSALQQGVVDGQENPFMNAWSSKLYEVQKYLTLSYHMWDVYSLTLNEKFYQSLDPDLQKIVLDSGREAADFGWKEMTKLNAETLQKLKDQGMLVTELNRQEVQNAVRPTWDSWLGRVGPDGKALIQRVLEIK
jgi:TRAP-type transport system periplasmic protein